MKPDAIKTEMGTVLTTVLDKHAEFENKSEVRFTNLEKKVEAFQSETDRKIDEKFATFEMQLNNLRDNTSSSTSEPIDNNTDSCLNKLNLVNTIALAEKTIGFHPITESDLVNKCSERNISDKQLG